MGQTMATTMVGLALFCLVSSLVGSRYTVGFEGRGRRPWGKVHMMRSGKRGDDNDDCQNKFWMEDQNSESGDMEQDSLEFDDTYDDSEEDTTAEIDDIEDLDVYSKVTKSANTILFGAPMIRIRKRSECADIGTSEGWGEYLVKSGIFRSGAKKSSFGGGHMMRSGKRTSSWEWEPYGTRLTGN